MVVVLEVVAREAEELVAAAKAAGSMGVESGAAVTMVVGKMVVDKKAAETTEVGE